MKQFEPLLSWREAVVCLGANKDVLVEDECRSWYNRVGDFVLLVWNEREEIWFSNRGSVEASLTNPTPACAINGTLCLGG